MKLNKTVFFLAAFLMVAACGEKETPVTPDEGKDNVENVAPEDSEDTETPETPETPADPETPTDPEVPADPDASLSLTFDFTDAEAMKDWPSSGALEGVEIGALLKAPYTLDGVTYEFTCANPLEATGANFPYYKSDNAYLYIKSYRYVGLPAIEGYKLTKVVLVNGGGENAERYVGITTKLAKQEGKTDEGQEFAKGGEPTAMSGGPDTEVEFNLSETVANTIYWVRFSPKTGALNGAILTYTK